MIVAAIEVNRLMRGCDKSSARVLAKEPCGSALIQSEDNITASRALKVLQKILAERGGFAPRRPSKRR
jgi:hypothetical protein